MNETQKEIKTESTAAPWGLCAAPCYAVFIRKQGEWIQQSISMVDYNEAQRHAKSVRKLMPFVEKTRVRRIPA